jgi:hypothetical protein
MAEPTNKQKASAITIKMGGELAPEDEAFIDENSEPADTPFFPSDSEGASEADAFLDDVSEQFEPASPSGADKAVAIGQGVTSGILQTGPMLTGGRMGFAATAAIPVPGARIVGTTLGLAGGWAYGQLGKHLAEQENIPGTDTKITANVNEIHPDLRPWFYSGETFSSGLNVARTTINMAKAGSRVANPGIAGRFINKILDAAAHAPKTTAVIELGSTTSASIGSHSAETLAPGQTAKRMGAEILLGALNPLRWVTTLGKAAVDSGATFLNSFSKAGRENKVAQVLQTIIEESGGDISVIAAALRAANISGTNPTTAQKAGDVALAAAEDRLRKINPGFDKEVKQRAEDTLYVMQELIAGLRATGDPSDVAKAGQIEMMRFKAVMAELIENAEQEAIAAGQKITKDTAKNKSILSKAAQGILGDSMTVGRGIEKELWNDVPGELMDAGADNLIAKHDELLTQILPEEGLPSIMTAFIKRMKGEPVEALDDEATAMMREVFGDAADDVAEEFAEAPTTVKELVLARGRFLAFARAAAADPAKRNEARMWGEMAEAALDDMDAAAANLGDDVLAAYHRARAFTAEFHDAFTRTFVGDAVQTNSKAANRIPPEVMMSRAMAGPKELGAVRFQEMMEATQFIFKNGTDSPAAIANMDTLLNVQERVIRLAADAAVDNKTGIPDAKKLRAFIKSHEEFMDMFPEVKKTLEEAVKSKDKLDKVTKIAFARQKEAAKTVVYGKLAKSEFPIDTVRDAIRGRFPIKDLDALMKMAKKGGPPNISPEDAVAGLRATIWEHMLREAGTPSGKRDISEVATQLLHIQKQLMDPIRPGQASLGEWMVKNGMMTADEFASSQIFFTEAAKTIDALTAGKGGEALLSDPTMLADFLSRFAGARAAAAVAGATPGKAGGSSIIVAGLGSKIGTKFFDKIPGNKIIEVFLEAARDPKFAATLLEKPVTKADELRLVRETWAFLVHAGLTGLEAPPDPPEPIAEPLGGGAGDDVLQDDAGLEALMDEQSEAAPQGVPEGTPPPEQTDPGLLDSLKQVMNDG